MIVIAPVSVPATPSNVTVLSVVPFPEAAATVFSKLSIANISDVTAAV